MHRNLNLGILAHVDAGKTSLTERLLFEAGVIDRVGSVDAGDTQTDSLELERRRGITIKSAVVSFELPTTPDSADVTRVNLIDTPGHPDFIAEVERALVVLDGAVLVISAVEGVQSQTRVLLRTLDRLGVPTLIFVNKIDRAGADVVQTLAGIRRHLTDRVMPMGSTTDLGRRSARFWPFGPDNSTFARRMLDELSLADDSLAAEFVAEDQLPGHDRLLTALAQATAAGRIHPVYLGSAITGAGLSELTYGIRRLLPTAAGDPGAAFQAQVFKVERGEAGDRIGLVRIRQGRLHSREYVRMPRQGRAKVTGIEVFADGGRHRVDAVAADLIAAVHGLVDVRIGDWLGRPTEPARVERLFNPPILETVVRPADPRDRGRLHTALSQLAEQDPLIDLRQDDVRQELYLSLYGEVQKEVIQATLSEQYGVAVSFDRTTTICIERPIGTGAALEFKDADDNPFLATVGLRVDPRPPGAGNAYQLEVELGSMPYAFMRAVEDTVRRTLEQGLHGWPVTDCLVSMTHSGYFPRQSHMGAKFDKSMSSTAGDFRNLTPMVLLAALQQAGTEVLEPMHTFELDLPADAVAVTLAGLARAEGVPLQQREVVDGFRLAGLLPAARVHELAQALPGLTHGLGVLSTEFDHYRPVRGHTPARPRTDHDPLNRKDYLLHMERHIRT